MSYLIREVTRIENISIDGAKQLLCNSYLSAKDRLNQAKQTAVLSQAALNKTVKKIRVFETTLDFFENLGGDKSLQRYPPPYYYVKPVEVDAIESVVNSLELPSTVATSLKELFSKTIGIKEGSIPKEEALKYFTQITGKSA